MIAVVPLTAPEAARLAASRAPPIACERPQDEPPGVQPTDSRPQAGSPQAVSRSPVGEPPEGLAMSA